MSHRMPHSLHNRLSAASFFWLLLTVPASLVAETNPALSDPAAEFVQLTADIDVLTWGEGLIGSLAPGQQSFQIHAVVGRSKWVLEGMYTNASPPAPAYQTNRYSFDGTNIVEQTWIQRTHSSESADGTNSSGDWWTRSAESADGNPSQTIGEADHLDMVARITWLAFCSAPTLNNPGHKLYPSWDFWKEYIDPSTFSEKITRFEDDLGLPKTVFIFSDENQPVVDYRVSATTNVSGWLFPSDFYLFQYNPTGTKGWMAKLFVHGKLISIAPASDPFPSPKVPSKEQALRFAPVSPSKVHVEGTSNSDDYGWSLETTNIVGFLELNRPLPSTPQSKTLDEDKLQAHAQFFLPVRHFNNGNSTCTFADQPDQAVLHQALRTTEQPNVIYRLDHLTLTNGPAAGIADYFFQSKGELVIGGITNVVSMPIKMSRRDDVLRLTGNTSFKLSDFGVRSPPVGNGWMINVADSVQTFFDLQLKRIETR